MFKIRDSRGRFAIKHGCAVGDNLKLYRVWGDIKQRCLNLNDRNYVRYGGRGIEICEEWLDFIRIFSRQL